MSLMAPILYVFLSPYPLIVPNSDAGFDHVTCFGQWDGSKLDSRELVECRLLSLGTCHCGHGKSSGNLGEWKTRWSKNEVFAWGHSRPDNPVNTDSEHCSDRHEAHGNELSVIQRPFEVVYLAAVTCWSKKWCWSVEIWGKSCESLVGL